MTAANKRRSAAIGCLAFAVLALAMLAYLLIAARPSENAPVENGLSIQIDYNGKRSHSVDLTICGNRYINLKVASAESTAVVANMSKPDGSWLPRRECSDFIEVIFFVGSSRDTLLIRETGVEFQYHKGMQVDDGLFGTESYTLECFFRIDWTRERFDEVMKAADRLGLTSNSGIYDTETIEDGIWINLTLSNRGRISTSEMNNCMPENVIAWLDTLRLVAERVQRDLPYDFPQPLILPNFTTSAI